MKEKNLKNRILLACSEKYQTVMFNNPVGFDKLRKIHYGLMRGSSDIIGWKSVKITPDMVGKSVAIFTAIEIKTKKGIVSDVQKNFIQRVLMAGGIAGVVRSEEGLRELLT